MAVGPQYQSQLALLAGALSHGLDPNQGLDMYQQTIAQAEAAREARKQAQQQTAATLAQLATQSATQGATPEQIGALVKSTAAGLPGGHSSAVHDEIHHILGHLSDYQATPDPMTQLQLQGQELDNQLKAQQLQAGATSTQDETLFGPQSMQQIQQAVAQYDQAGLDLPTIRQTLYGQLGVGQDPSLKPVIDSTISQAWGKLHPQLAAQNLAMFGATPKPPPPPEQSGLHSPSFLGTVEAGALTGGGLGAAAGTIIPGAGTIAGGVGGALVGGGAAALGYLTRGLF